MVYWHCVVFLILKHLEIGSVEPALLVKYVKGEHNAVGAEMSFECVVRFLNGPSLHLLRVSQSYPLQMKNVVFWDINPSSYFTGSTLCLRYIAQPINSM
jgi:hypothetical protein